RLFTFNELRLFRGPSLTTRQASTNRSFVSHPSVLQINADWASLPVRALRATTNGRLFGSCTGGKAVSGTANTHLVRRRAADVNQRGTHTLNSSANFKLRPFVLIRFDVAIR
ncbi:unnamed protein product, partial [Ectocarpus sp. 12 AP-2014]